MKKYVEAVNDAANETICVKWDYSKKKRGAPPKGSPLKLLAINPG